MFHRILGLTTIWYYAGIRLPLHPPTCMYAPTQSHYARMHHRACEADGMILCTSCMPLRVLPRLTALGPTGTGVQVLPPSGVGLYGGL
eukprot:2011439-Rhodomonas_salina.1